MNIPSSDPKIAVLSERKVSYMSFYAKTAFIPGNLQNFYAISEQ